MTAPHTPDRLVGLERDLGAADHVFNVRSYRFSASSDSGAATHTIATPAANTTYTRRLHRRGPAINTPPTVAIDDAGQQQHGQSRHADHAHGQRERQRRRDRQRAVLRRRTADRRGRHHGPFSVNWTPSTTGVHTLTARATDDRGGTTTSAAVSVTINVIDLRHTAADGEHRRACGVGRRPRRHRPVPRRRRRQRGCDQRQFQVDAWRWPPTRRRPTRHGRHELARRGQHVLRVRARDGAGNHVGWSQRDRALVHAEAPAGITRTPSCVDRSIVGHGVHASCPMTPADAQQRAPFVGARR